MISPAWTAYAFFDNGTFRKLLKPATWAAAELQAAEWRYRYPEATVCVIPVTWKGDSHAT